MIGAARLGKEIAVHRLRVLPVDLFHALHPYRSPFRFVVYKCARFSCFVTKNPVPEHRIFESFKKAA